jgi:Glycosyltransferase 61
MSAGGLRHSTHPTGTIGRNHSICSAAMLDSRSIFSINIATGTRRIRGSSTDLFVLENGLLFNRSLYKAIDGEIVQMYEREPPRRPAVASRPRPASDLRDIQQPRNAATDFFYLGSIGSENYGHWLIDDLTRVRSILEHFAPGNVPTIVLNSYFPVIDDVRHQTLHALTSGFTDIEVIFLKYRAAYFFPWLFFVSPSSHHPFMKRPQGVAFLRDHFVAQATRRALHAGDPANAAGGKRFFVTRRALWRNVINLDEVIASFLAFDSEIVELEKLFIR